MRPATLDTTLYPIASFATVVSHRVVICLPLALASLVTFPTPPHLCLPLFVCFLAGAIERVSSVPKHAACVAHAHTLRCRRSHAIEPQSPPPILRRVGVGLILPADSPSAASHNFPNKSWSLLSTPSLSLVSFIAHFSPSYTYLAHICNSPADRRLTRAQHHAIHRTHVSHSIPC